MKNIFIKLTFLFCLPGAVFAQRKKIDSLLLELEKNPQQDTVRLNILNYLSSNYKTINSTEGIKKANEAIELAKQLNNNAKLATALTHKGHNLLTTKDYSLTLEMYDQAIKIHKKENDSISIAKLIYAKGLVFYNKSDYIKSSKQHRKALKIFKNANDSIYMAKMYNSLAINYMFLSKYPQSLSKFLEALSIYEQFKPMNHEGYAQALTNLGMIYNRLENFDEAINYHKRAIKIFKSIDYESGVEDNLMSLGNIYDNLNETKKAIGFYNQALEIAKKTGDERRIANLLTNLGIAISTSTSALDEYEKALTYFEQAKKVYAERSNHTNLSIVHKYIAFCYFKISKNSPSRTFYLKKAKTNYEKALAHAVTVGSVKLQASILKEMADLNEKVGDYEEAYKTITESFVLRDSFNSVEKHEEIARLEADFKHNQEKAALEATFAKSKAMADAKIKHQTLIKKIAIGAGLFLLSFAVFGYFLYKKRRDAEQQKNIANLKIKIAEAELKGLRAQMNPHFIFNSLNSISDYLLHNNVKKADEYLVKFSKLTRSVLENSEKKWITLKEDIELLKSYIELESLRLGNKLSYEIEIAKDIDIENTLIPPLILQPFVENSIWHGISKKENGGKLLIKIKNDLTRLICIVEDDGIGRNKLSKKSGGKSLGLDITNQRLEIINNIKQVNGAINFVDKEEGLQVELSLPLEHKF